METIANIILAAGAISAAAYCHILAGRLKRFTDLENGMGGAIANLSKKVEELNASLRRAKDVASKTENSVSSQTARAEDTARRLELLLASMHDLDVAEKRAAKDKVSALS